MKNNSTDNNPNVDAVIEDLSSHFSILMNHLPQKVFIKDKKSVYIACNQNYANDLGIQTEEIVGKTDNDFYPEEIADKYRADDQRIMESGVAEEIEEPYIVGGEEFSVHTTKTPIFNEDGELLGLLGIFRGITEKEKANEALQLSEERFRSMIEHTSDAIFCYEYDPPIPIDLPIDKQVPLFYRGVLAECNDVAAKSHGAEKSIEVVGKKLTEVFRTSPRSLDGFFRFFIQSGYNVEGLEGEEVLEDGTKRFFRNNGHGIIENSLLKRVWGTYQEITEKKDAEKLIRIQRDLGFALTTTRDLEEILNLCLENALQASDMDAGGIYLIDDNTGGMDLVHHTGLPEDFVKSSLHYDADTPNVKLVKQGNPIYTRHKELGIDLEGPRAREGLRAIGIIPIQNEGEVIACLNIASHELDDVPKFSRTSLETIASQIGSAIARGKAERELDKYRDNLEELIEERTIELSESEARLRAFVKAVPDLIFILDENGLYHEVLTSKENLLYKDAASLKGKLLHQVLPTEAADSFLSVVKETIKTETSQKYEYPLEVLEGTRWFEGQTALIPASSQGNENAKMVVWISRDITERKKAEDAVRESEARFRAVFENSPLGIIIVGQQSQVIDANDALASMLDYTRQDLLGKTMIDLTHPEDFEEALDMVRQSISDGTSAYSHEIRLVAKSGQAVWSNIASTMLNDDKGIPSMGVSVVEDITERKKAREELQKLASELARSNKELEQFAYIASHDLQEPLRKIQAFGNRIDSSYKEVLDERGQDYLIRMQDAAERGQRMINDLLELSRVTTKGKPFKNTDLNQVLQDVLSDLEMHIERSKGSVEVGNLPIIDADQTQMRQLFQNLINNALKFHKPDTPPKVSVSANGETPGRVQIQVQDNGIGFDEEYIERVFKPFERLHGQGEYEGSGIGLSVCRKIVERHGGTLGAKSKSGEGATFIVTLPKQQKSGGTSN